MNVLFVPSIGLDVSLLDRLAASVDYPVRFKMAFNNGPVGALDDFGNRHRDWIVKETDVGNMGVAGSWNECAKLFPEEPSWLLMNEDSWFSPGYLERICKCADQNTNAPAIFLNNSNAFYCFVWTSAGKKQFGTFDANLWPAYYEDCDMRIRHRLKGVTAYPYALPGLPPLQHGKPKCGGINYAAMIQGTGLLNRAYWVRKWGSFDLENAAYQNPYRDPRIPPTEWVWYPEHRAALWPIWEAFINMPGRSIYT